MSEDIGERLWRLGATAAAVARLRGQLQTNFRAPTGSVLVSQDRSAEHLLVMEDGWAVRSRLLPDGRRQSTALFLGGDVCDLDTLALGG